MPDNELTISVHSLIHKADEAMCSTRWDDMSGDNSIRTCPQCKAAVFRVDQNPDAFCKEAENLQLIKMPHKAYRRLDGTYTFSDRNCSPKKLFTPVQSDLRGVAITNWWSDRYGRYNKYLFIYGFIVGGIPTLEVAGGGFAGIAFGIFCACALGCAVIANLIFGLCILLNLAIPGFLGPARKHAGPLLLGLSMLTVGLYMTGPLIVLHGNVLGRFFPGLQG